MDPSMKNPVAGARLNGTILQINPQWDWPGFWGPIQSDLNRKG